MLEHAADVNKHSSVTSVNVGSMSPSLGSRGTKASQSNCVTVVNIRGYALRATSGHFYQAIQQKLTTNNSDACCFAKPLLENTHCDQTVITKALATSFAVF